MGSRGASGRDNVVEYGKWGPEKDLTLIKDDAGTVIGNIRDEMEYDMEPDIRSITKAKALDEVDAWLNDKDDTYGWSYGDDDVSIGIYYDDGTYVSKDDLNGKKFKKKGVRGISISTGDYEIVWGEAYYRKSKEWWPLQTWSEDGESGMSNVYSGYRTSKQRHVRVKETYVYDEKTKRHTRKREKIRVSTWKEV